MNTEKSTLEVEREALQNTDEEKGWVLLDFPSSYAQAKLLEEALTGYKPSRSSTLFKETSKWRTLSSSSSQMPRKPHPSA